VSPAGRSRATISTLGTATTARNLGFADNDRSTRDGGSSMTADSESSRRDFLTYCLSLMRAHNSEHRDSLPVLDVTALRHVAYVLDAILFYMRATNDCDLDRTTNGSNVWDDQDENENEETEEDISASIVMDSDSVDEDMLSRPSLGRRHSFFQRSDSTLCLGCPAPDPFNTPLIEALPLADQPHRLQPTAKREDLFGMPKWPITLAPGASGSQHHPTNVGAGSSENVAGASCSTVGGATNLELPPVRLSLSSTIRHEMGSSQMATGIIVDPSESLYSESQQQHHQQPSSQDGTVAFIDG
uniref:Uncharacterized protein n=1 Tax=Anopheles maculatus TaxID=74869 RepID=A0A182SB89_9DIPT